jgi:hypothetical protein
MPLTVNWYNDAHDVLIFKFGDHWTWSEFQAQKSYGDSLMESVTHRCALIMLAPAKVKVPPNAISNGRAMLGNKHRNAELFVITSPDAFVRSLATILGGLPNLRGVIQVATTLEEAETKVRRAGFFREDAANVP